MVHSYTLYGVTLRTGDLICTQDGNQHALFSQVYELLGQVIPGPVDHIAVYVGPGPRFVEAGPFGVIDFELPGETWDAGAIFDRRLIADTIYGIADPTVNRGFSAAMEGAIRFEVGKFINEQAEQHKPYNVNFFNSYSLDAFYCSQLPYMAYRRHGLNLNTGQGIPELPGVGSIIFPTEVWNACHQVRLTTGQQPPTAEL